MGQSDVIRGLDACAKGRLGKAYHLEVRSSVTRIVPSLAWVATCASDGRLPAPVVSIELASTGAR